MDAKYKHMIVNFSECQECGDDTETIMLGGNLDAGYIKVLTELCCCQNLDEHIINFKYRIRNNGDRIIENINNDGVDYSLYYLPYFYKSKLTYKYFPELITAFSLHGRKGIPERHYTSDHQFNLMGLN